MTDGIMEPRSRSPRPPGARHGWVPSDTPVHDPAAAERHHEALFTLFEATLGR